MLAPSEATTWTLYTWPDAVLGTSTNDASPNVIFPENVRSTHCPLAKVRLWLSPWSDWSPLTRFKVIETQPVPETDVPDGTNTTSSICSDLHVVVEVEVEVVVVVVLWSPMYFDIHMSLEGHECPITVKFPWMPRALMLMGPVPVFLTSTVKVVT